VLTKQFKKDVEALKARGEDMAKLRAVMDDIINRCRLSAARVDHPLKGQWKGCRDCHISGDWVLIYELAGAAVCFHRTGTHSDLGF